MNVREVTYMIKDFELIACHLRFHFIAFFILLSEPYCHNGSGRQGSNLRLSAPKALVETML